VKNKIYFIMNAVATGALRERVSVVEMIKVRKRIMKWNEVEDDVVDRCIE